MKKIIPILICVTLVGYSQIADSLILTDIISKSKNTHDSILERSARTIDEANNISIQANTKAETIRKGYEYKIAKLKKQLLTTTFYDSSALK